jgi:hypothetical protein
MDHALNLSHHTAAITTHPMPPPPQVHGGIDLSGGSHGGCFGGHVEVPVPIGHGHVDVGAGGCYTAGGQIGGMGGGVSVHFHPW